MANTDELTVSVLSTLAEPLVELPELSSDDVLVIADTDELDGRLEFEALRNRPSAEGLAALFDGAAVTFVAFDWLGTKTSTIVSCVVFVPAGCTFVDVLPSAVVL